MKLILTGATGLIGSEVLSQAIVNNEIEDLILLVRSPPEIQHSKIQIIQHSDFTNFTGLETCFKTADAIIWCLGISQTQVSKNEYETITYVYTKACIDFCTKINPSIRFVFVSGNGADRTEKSRLLFKKVKGKTENALLQSGMLNIIITRPDAVRPRQKNKRAPFVYKFVYPLLPLVEILAPHKVIWSDILAKALIFLAIQGNKKVTLENKELRQLGSLRN